MENNINYAKALKIFKTLPIGYYFGNRIEAELSETSEDTFINLLELKITISYPLISEKYSHIKNTEDAELIIRTFLYHEVSHAILTPVIKEELKNPEAVNIFEDERIETILENYYLNVNFKYLVNLTDNDFTSEDPISVFYRKVRLRQCTQEENELIERLISKYSKLNRTSSCSKAFEYINDIYELYKILTDVKPLTEKQKEFVVNLYSVEIGDKPSETNPILSYLDINDVQIDNKSFRLKLANILHRNAKIKGTDNSVMAKTSGKLNPILLTKPDNYKWFESSGDSSHFKEGKIKFNLFIDQSGSFTKNYQKVNSILKELIKLEREIPLFSFDLVTLDNEIELKNKKKRFILTNEKRYYGNSLNPELFSIYRKLQDFNSKVINIILFDGVMTCDPYKMKDGTELKSHSKEQRQCLKAFNHPNDIIISDTSNQNDLKQYCRNAHINIAENFLTEFEDILLKKIQILF